MSALPDIGQLIVFEPGAALRAGTVGVVTKRKELKAGVRLTVVTGGTGYSSEIESKPLKKLPPGWTVMTGSELYEALPERLKG